MHKIDGRFGTNLMTSYLLCGPVNPVLGDAGTKTLRQLQAEEDDEERFQADLKKAVRQSLGKDFLSFCLC